MSRGTLEQEVRRIEKGMGMKKACKILSYIFLAVGSMFTALMIGGGIRAFLVSAFATFVVVVVFLALSEILERLENLEQQQTEYYRTLSSVILKETDEEKIMAAGGWKCVECGKVNHAYVGTCDCGKVKE